MGYSHFIQHLIGLIRANEWWEYKLVPILSAFYATALVLRIPIRSLWISALSLLLAVAAAAIYASVINDVTDLAADLQAGKPNRLAGRSRRLVVTMIALSTGTGLLFAWFWRGDVRLVVCYAAIWVAFSLYSFPGIRLKERGVAGVLSCAAGEQLLPSLVAVFLAARNTGPALNGPWLATVAIWAFAYGLRGIVWHQLNDIDHDRAAGFRTFALRHPRAARLLGTFVVFPLELCALAAMLWQIGSVWPPVSLVLYALYAVRSARRWQTTPVIVVPKPQSFNVLHQFYSDLFPLALLIALSVRDRRGLILLAVHLVLFPRNVVHAIRRLSASIARTVVKASEPHHGGVR